MKVNINISGEWNRKKLFKYLLIVALLYKAVPIDTCLFLFEQQEQKVSTETKK